MKPNASNCLQIQRLFIRPVDRLCCPAQRLRQIHHFTTSTSLNPVLHSRPPMATISLVWAWSLAPRTIEIEVDGQAFPQALSLRNWLFIYRQRFEWTQNPGEEKGLSCCPLRDGYHGG